MYKYTSVQVYKCTSIQVYKYTSIPELKYTSIHVYFAFVWGHRWNAEVEFSCSRMRTSLVVVIQASILYRRIHTWKLCVICNVSTYLQLTCNVYFYMCINGNVQVIAVTTCII